MPPEQRHVLLEKLFFVPVSVKDLIESFGVPHTEVDLILVNGVSVGFDYRLQAGDRVIAIGPEEGVVELESLAAAAAPVLGAG